MLDESWLTPYKLRKIQIIGTKGVVDADLIDMRVTLKTQHWCMEANINKLEPLKLEINHMINSINNKNSTIIDLYEAKNTLKLTLSALKSAQVNEIIKFDE